MESDVTQALSLGGITDGVDNVELTAAYASIANKGLYNKPTLYTTVEDDKGNVILKNSPQNQQVMKETTAWLLTDAMKDVIKKGTGEEAHLSSDMAVAGKTGTTSNNYDYWFCGFTPYYTASIWTGYDYNTSFDNDEDYHKLIWAKIMDQIIEKQKLAIRDFDECSNIEEATICMKSGKLPVTGVCSHDPVHSMKRTEYFAEGTVPTENCDSHIAVRVCTESHQAAGEYCPVNKVVKRIYRIRPKGSSGKTEDSAYSVSPGFANNKCNIHTKEWYDAKKKREEEERKKQELLKQQQQQQQQQQQPIPGTQLPDLGDLLNPSE